MGYRSDVYMCITGPIENILSEIVTLRFQGDADILKALDEWAVVATSEKHAAMTLGGEGVSWKWYPDFPDVRAHLAVYAHFRELSEERASDTSANFNGVFIRVGEDDDSESRHFGDGYELGSLQRSIYREHDGSGVDLRPRLAAVAKASHD